MLASTILYDSIFDAASLRYAKCRVGGPSKPQRAVAQRPCVRVNDDAEASRRRSMYSGEPCSKFIKSILDLLVVKPVIEDASYSTRLLGRICDSLVVGYLSTCLRQR